MGLTLATYLSKARKVYREDSSSRGNKKKERMDR